MSEALAKERLVTLLDYVDEVAKMHQLTASEESLLQLTGGFDSDDGAAFVLHEDVLRRLLEVKQQDTGVPCCQLSQRGDDNHGGAWMRLRRPDSVELRDAGAGKLLCSVYAALFSAHQEALREGRGAQVTAGVGILRWKRADGKVVDHPLVTVPAELQLDADGALVIRMGDGAQASLWPMPGLDGDAAQALRRILESAKDFATGEHPHGVLGTASPPSPVGETLPFH